MSANAYYTTSGDNPIIHDQAYMNDLNRSAGGWSDVSQEWVPQYYSAKRFGEAEKKRQHRNYWTVVSYIHANQDDPTKLRRAWQRFWKRWKQEKINWISPKHRDIIKCEFKKRGFITSLER